MTTTSTLWQDATQIREQRARLEQYGHDQLYITAHYCSGCGTRLNDAGHCPHGCSDNATSAAIISAYEKRQAVVMNRAACDWCGQEFDEVDLYGWQYDPMTGLYAAKLCGYCLPNPDEEHDEPPACGNYPADEVADTRHPM